MKNKDHVTKAKTYRFFEAFKLELQSISQSNF